MTTDTYDATPYCFCWNIGRETWIEGLGLEPTGDCAGPLYRLLGSADPAGNPVHCCERHLLQYFLSGRRMLATLVKKAPALVGQPTDECGAR